MTDEDDKRARILDAAFLKFAAYGLSRTSMADVADGAGMSRPALYQYYANKDEIFSAVLERALATAADRALAELNGEGRLADQLDGFLQRWFGDMVEQLMTTQHGSELVEAKAGHAKPVADAANARVRRALVDHMSRAVGAPRTKAEVTEVVDLLMLGPVGLKYDSPPIAKFRRRLSSLARTVAESVRPS